MRLLLRLRINEVLLCCCVTMYCILRSGYLLFILKFKYFNNFLCTRSHGLFEYCILSAKRWMHILDNNKHIRTYAQNSDLIAYILLRSLVILIINPSE